MLLGSSEKNVTLSLRLFPEAQPRFSLRQRDAKAKRFSLHAGLLNRAVETRSAKEEHTTDPTLISQRMLCFPRGFARAKSLSLYAGYLPSWYEY